MMNSGMCIHITLVRPLVDDQGIHFVVEVDVMLYTLTDVLDLSCAVDFERCPLKAVRF